MCLGVNVYCLALHVCACRCLGMCAYECLHISGLCVSTHAFAQVHVFVHLRACVQICTWVYTGMCLCIGDCEFACLGTSMHDHAMYLCACAYMTEHVCS